MGRGLETAASPDFTVVINLRVSTELRKDSTIGTLRYPEEERLRSSKIKGSKTLLLAHLEACSKRWNNPVSAIKNILATAAPIVDVCFCISHGFVKIPFEGIKDAHTASIVLIGEQIACNGDAASRWNVLLHPVSDPSSHHQTNLLPTLSGCPNNVQL
ncbi:hypothetical protein T265_04163 [Opisthorchis viverrini]|uniref:Uncharacterized protein n=1 Tax=Opisthorchis viverrini TaxID=6198 RepID=A0A075A0Z6_OPIVI|nr:hypothetical protein T265_04163 [Opisthorchis viverrini]KER29155.1 hypothetical protein T265_04163 [Opisthorchis viverrini]